MKLTLVLPYGLAAEVVIDTSERPSVVPPPSTELARCDHTFVNDDPGCVKCGWVPAPWHPEVR